MEAVTLDLQDSDPHLLIIFLCRKQKITLIFFLTSKAVTQEETLASSEGQGEIVHPAWVNGK